MAIQTEVIDFIVNISAIRAKYPGGWDACRRDIEHLIGGRIWHDDYLLRDGTMSPSGIAFFGDRTEAERADGAASIINAMSAEASIMARCTGKTDVRNIEPEDLRSITLASSKAFGIPLAGQKRGTVIEAAE